ncbi:glycosyltransferase [Cereibacter azotoformans]|uniref:O-antigen polymerase n=1 Tax=Cereibacter sphaeroides (strain ATCC 17025 / ATH 2.4.3) TaxID=349102 RepID=A4WY13_CERS5|nr:glycosyltransferase [Cereibacter azotoformans]ULB11726.1 glycosyltransferase [Cereibacter azotoformans]
MKILVVVSEFPKLTETFVYRNIAEYRRAGHGVRLFYAKKHFPQELVHGFARETADSAFTFGFLAPQSLLALGREVVRHPVRQIRLWKILARSHRHEIGRGLRSFAVLPKSVALGHWCRSQGIDHIHAEFAGFPATVAMIAARVSGVPFSFSAHANDIFVSQALLPEKAAEARFVRAISRYNIDWLGRLPSFPADRLRLIHCGVPRALLEAPEPDPPGSGPLNVLYVGSLIEKKGVFHLLEALAQLRDRMPLRCRIIGRGDLEGAMRQAAERLGLNGIVTFDGPKDAEEVRAAYGWAHAVVVPSVVGAGGRVEGIPVVAMEALAHARPLVASRLSGIPELVEDGVTGWLTEPGDAAGIARALAAIREDWPRAVTLARAGRDRVRAEYLIEDNAAELLRAIEEAA